MIAKAAVFRTTADSGDALLQAVSAFQHAIDVETTGASGEVTVVFSFSLVNPMVAASSGRSRNEFSVKETSYYLDAPLRYADWIEPDWRRRMFALAEAASAALDAPDKLRPAEPERDALKRSVDAAAQIAAETPPDSVSALLPVYQTVAQDGTRLGISFERPHVLQFGPWRFVEILPDEAERVAAEQSTDTPALPDHFKLYRLGDGRIDYREAWIDDEKVVEHWGTCGTEGETQRHRPENPQSLLLAIQAEAAESGYDEIELSRHRCVVAFRQVSDMGTDDELETRYALQAALDERLGWLGLGHCDGGASGGGAMEVFCFVVDARLGLDAVSEVLAEPPFEGYRAELR